MDFIERFFHVSPDGGNGTTEILWMVAIAVFFLVVVARKRIVKLLLLTRPLKKP